MSYALLRRGLDVAGQTVVGADAAATVIATLVREGVEMHVEPLPDERWQVTVKREARSVLIDAVKAVLRAVPVADMVPEQYAFWATYMHDDTGAEAEGAVIPVPTVGALRSRLLALPADAPITMGLTDDDLDLVTERLTGSAGSVFWSLAIDATGPAIVWPYMEQVQ